MATQLHTQLGLDRFWAEHLPASRKRTRWDLILQALARYRLIAPGSEWRLHREWYINSAMADLLGAGFELADSEGQQAFTLSREKLRQIRRREDRIEAHIFVAFLAYALHVTLRCRLRELAPGLTPRAVLEKLAAIPMVDVHPPTTDGREIILTRYTQPEPDVGVLLRQLKLHLPPQPPPRLKVQGKLIPQRLL